MKTKFLVFTLMFLLLFLSGCSFKNCNSKKHLLENIEYFDVNAQINNEDIHLIKSSQGIYLEVLDNILFYNQQDQKVYRVDDDQKILYELSDNYQLNTYEENIKYILTYHINKKSFTKYQKTTITYLDQNVTKYIFNNEDTSEEFLVANDTYLGLGFKLKTKDQSVSCSINKIVLEDIDLSYLNQYTIVNNHKNQLEYYEMNVDIDGIKYHIINNNNGIYYYNLTKNYEIYLNKKSGKMYSINSKNEFKIEINDKSEVDSLLNDLNYLLNYHHDKTIYLTFDCSNATYLNRDIKIYQYQKDDHEEEIYVDNKLNICLSFKLKIKKSEVSSSIESLKLENIDLSYLDNYTLLQKCDNETFIKKEEIINSFKEYHLVLKQNDKIITYLKNQQGFVFIIEQNDEKTGLLYDQEKNAWYNLYLDSLEKSLNTNNEKIETFEDSLFSLLTIHLDVINNHFYKENDFVYLDKLTTKYIRNSISNSFIYNQEYIVDNQTSICLKQVINLNGSITSFELLSLSFTADISEYLMYNEFYQKWPTNIDLLEDIPEIEYGTFVRAKYQDDGFNIWYKDINDSFFKQILKDFKAIGFINNQTNDNSNDTQGNIIYYKYYATNDKNISIYLEYFHSDQTLVIILNHLL